MKIFSEIKIKKVVFGLISTFLLTLGASFSYAADDRQALQDKLSNLNSKIQNLTQDVNRVKQQGATLKNEIFIYDSQIQATELQIDAKSTQIEDTKLQITELQNQIERRQKEIADNKKILSELIVQLNELGGISMLNMTLGSDNFSQFLDQVEYTTSVQGKVYQILENVKAVKARLEQQQADLKAQLNRMEELKEQLEITQESLSSQKENKETLLQQTKGQESKYQQALSQSKNEQADILKEIQDLDAKARAGKAKSISASKGVLAYPMGGVMTQGYGNTGFTSLGYNFHNGIDLAAPAGTPIYAAADGVVNACDTGEAAYGNWCTVKHTIKTKSGNRDIVTLYAHMRKFGVSKGKAVKQGDLIGYEGNTGNTSRLLYGPERGYHLHFTVFDADGFAVTPGKYGSVYGSYSVPNGYTYNPLQFLGN